MISLRLFSAKLIGTQQVCHSGENGILMDENQQNSTVNRQSKPKQSNSQQQGEDTSIQLGNHQLSPQTQSGFQRNIITKTADGILVLDSQGIIRFVNPAAEVLFGRSSQELLGSPFGFPLVAGETTELDILRRNQAPVVAEMRMVEMVWEDHVGLLASLRDVTKRKQQQREIEERNVVLEHHVEESAAEVSRLNERLNAIFKTARNIIILVAADGRIEIANPALARKFGYFPNEIANQPLSRLVIPSQKEELDGWVRQVIDNDESQRHQVMGISKEGHTFDMEISLARVRDNDNHVVVTLHDISHFKTVARMKDNFISMVSHELRSPVTSLSLISGALQTFYERYTESQVRQKLAELNNQCQVLMDLIESVLDISRLEAQNGQILKAGPVDMTATLKSIVTELQANVISKKQTLATFYDDQPLTLRGDQLDFARIWRNLISNAVKYTAKGGQIIVRLECMTTEDISQSRLSQKETLSDYLEDGRTYIIGQVEDNGHGINPADLPTLFQRFNRGWAQTSDIPGTGLGLALVRELLALYQGDIHVSSQLGKGSTFTFWLPV